MLRTGDIVHAGEREACRTAADRRVLVAQRVHADAVQLAQPGERVWDEILVVAGDEERPLARTKSRNGSAADPSSSTVPSTRSPTIATRSGSVSLIIRDDPLGVRTARQRTEVDIRHHGEPKSVERRIQSAQAHRHPQ